MISELRRLLEPLCGEDAIVSVYCDNWDRGSFLLGYVIDLDEDDVLLNLLSPGGVEDGFAVVAADSIVGASEDRPYSARILKLSLLKGQKNVRFLRRREALCLICWHTPRRSGLRL